MIPNVLAQLYIPPVVGMPLPPEVKYQCDFWKKFHPNFQYKLLDLDDIFELLSQRKNWADALLALHLPAMQSDLARLIWLYFKGGFYSDLKLFPTQDILSSLLDHDLVLIEHWPIERRPDPAGFFANGFIGCAPKSPIIKEMIKEIVYNINARCDADVFNLTGGKVFSKYMNKLEPYQNNCIHVLNHSTWGTLLKVGSGKYNEKLGHWTKRMGSESIYVS